MCFIHNLLLPSLGSILVYCQFSLSLTFKLQSALYYYHLAVWFCIFLNIMHKNAQLVFCHLKIQLFPTHIAYSSKYFKMLQK